MISNTSNTHRNERDGEKEDSGLGITLTTTGSLEVAQVHAIRYCHLMMVLLISAAGLPSLKAPPNEIG